MSQASGQGIGRDKVVELISSVIKKVEEKSDVSREAIYSELNELREIIDQARHDIRETAMGEIGGKHIPTATDELDAVVAATEVATGNIMDGCDAISAHAAKLPAGDAEILTTEVTKILEACSFQDITGQRISKVVKSLKTIDEKVARLLSILSENIPDMGTREDVDTRTGDARLLNGPQMADKAISQDDIDKLLADLF